MEANANVTDGVQTGTENVTGSDNGQGQESGANAAETPKTYTAEELQAEADRRVTEAVKTANAKSEEAFKKQIAAAREQWEKEAKMTAAEREKAAQDKAKADFEKEKAEFAHEKLVSRAGSLLVKNGLPEEIAELITASDSDEETIGNGVAAIKTAFDKAVQAAVEEKLKGKPPKFGGGNNDIDPFLSGFGI